MFVPVIRKRIPTGRRGANGHKVTRVIAKPMFPGYGFLRATETNDPEGLDMARASRDAESEASVNSSAATQARPSDCLTAP
jgi:hypothetical protein